MGSGSQLLELLLSHFHLPQGWFFPRRMKLPKSGLGKRDPPYPLLHPGEWDPP